MAALIKHCDGSKMTIAQAFASVWPRGRRGRWVTWRTRSGTDLEMSCGCPHPFARFKCEGCGNVVGYCFGGAPDVRCDDCVVKNPTRKSA